MNIQPGQLSDDLQILLDQIDADLVKVEQITRLPSPRSARATYKLTFSNGQVIKGRNLESEKSCDYLVRLRSRLSFLPMSRVISHRGPALLEEWVAGKTLTGEDISADRLYEAGDLLGQISQVDLPAELKRTALLEPGRQLTRTIRHLTSLADNGNLTSSAAKKLEKFVIEKSPSWPESGLVHRDFCADNLVLNLQGELVCIDNENLCHGHLDGDLARSWFRWPMQTWQRNEFIAGYESHRKVDEFLANEWYWSISILSASAHFRVLRQQPVSAISDCLNLLADGDHRGLWPKCI